MTSPLFSSAHQNKSKSTHFELAIALSKVVEKCVDSNTAIPISYSTIPGILGIASPASLFSASTMSKRSWQEANLPSPRSAPAVQRAGSSSSPHSYNSPRQSASPKKIRNSVDEPPLIAKAPPKPQRANSANGGQAEPNKLPGISRKVKACAACRKQKVWTHAWCYVKAANPILVDKMYYARRSTMPTVQRARPVMSTEQELTNTHVRRFEVESSSNQGR